MTFATIGYEKSTLDDFIATLLMSGIKVLIDVRQLPLSRRKGFSKTAIAAALKKEGIDYIHLKGLGDPKEGRDAAKVGDYGKFLRIFSAHMKTQEYKSALERATALAEQGGACLMCYERDPVECHRKLISESISSITNFPAQHLGVSLGIAKYGQKTSSRKRIDTGESTATRG